MKLKLTICVGVLFCAPLGSAEDLAPDVWLKGTNGYCVGSYDIRQVKYKNIAEKHIVLAIDQQSWESPTNNAQAKIKADISKYLSGSKMLTYAKMVALVADVDDTNFVFTATDTPVDCLNTNGIYASASTP